MADVKEKLAPEGKSSWLAILIFGSGQVLGLLPLTDITNPFKVHMKYLSIKFFYTCLLILSFAILSSFSLVYLIFVKFSTATLLAMVFFASITSKLVAYAIVAKRLPQIMKQWYQLEKAMTKNYGDVRESKKKLGMVFLAYLAFCSLEFVISAERRDVLLKIFGIRTFTKGIYKSLDYVFHFVTPSIPMAHFIMIINELGANIMRYSDFFIILLTVGMAVKFQQINRRIKKGLRKERSVAFWQDVRENYDKVSRLFLALNEEWSLIVLLSFGMQCWDALIILNNLRESVTAYRLGRSLSVFVRLGGLIGSGIYLNNESKRPSFMIQFSTIPIYNIEINRLLLQIRFDQVAVGAFNLFKIKKGVVLTVAEALIAYELVMIQFQLLVI